MKIKEAKKFMSKQIKELEQATYMFENIVMKRYEADKAVLASLREQYFKLLAVEQKIEKGLNVPDDELNEGIPSQFR